MLATWKTILRRRAALAERLEPELHFEALEESCVPSYCHRNVLAAAVAWWRLVAVAGLSRRYSASGPLLDFGAGTGEIAELLRKEHGYHFIEADERLAQALLHWHPQARRERLDALPQRFFRTVLALDSLEHNDDLGAIVARLAESLADEGVFVLSGPTETRLYKLGRKIAGFGGHYHKHTIDDVEREVARRFTMVRVARVPPFGVLFRVSVWRKRSAA